MSEPPDRPRSSLPKPAPSLAHWLVLMGVLALGLGSYAWRVLSAPAATAPQFAVSAPSATLALVERVSTHDIPMPPGVPAAHASSLLAVPNSPDMLAAWFAGSRESGADVQIWMARFDAAARRWSDPHPVLNRHALAAEHLGFGIRRLGNPVLWRDASGRLQVFVVATGLGGWAASRVFQAALTESSGAQTPQWRVTAARVLPLSPLWNISTLVRTNPVAYTDGGALLPLYFELWRKYPLALRLGAQGEFLTPVRLSHQGGGLQPAVVASSPTSGLAFMRDFASQAVRVAQTSDGGHGWRDQEALSVPNPNASVAALRLNDGSLVMAANPLTTGRHQLSLLRSTDGVTWQAVEVLAQAPVGAEFSYPALALSADGTQLHVSYTFERRRIAHRVFDVRPATANTAPEGAGGSKP